MNDEVKVLDMTHADEVIREVDGGVAPTMQSRMGTGGNQVPLVMEPNAVAIDQQGGKGAASFADGVAPTMAGDSHGTPHAVAVRTANTHANGHGVADEATNTLDRASGQAVAIGLDRRNQAGADEVQPALQSSVSDGGSTVCVGVKYFASEKSREPCSIDIAQALATCPDSAVAIGFKAGQSANGGLGEEAEVSPTMSHQPSALEPTVAIGVSFDGRKDAPVIPECAHTECVGTNPGFKNGVATMLKVRCGKDTYTKPDGSIGTAGKDPLASEESAFTLAATQDQSLVLRHIVRRLTPTECERLQAFPDGWTRIPYRGKPADQCPDSPRYKALGNSWATNCAEWILRRIVAAVRLGMI